MHNVPLVLVTHWIFCLVPPVFPFQKQLSVIVEDKEGTRYQVTAQLKTKISALRVILEAQHDLSTEDCTFYYKKQPLDDSKSLFGCGINPDSIIRLVHNNDKVS